MTRPPRATYRLQLSPDFTFADAALQVPYLARLGVSHLYLSPISEACAGSTHGYDVTDPARFRAALGGEDGFLAFHRTAKAADLRLLLDIVPNHMAASHDNPYWMDALEFGADGPRGALFDIDWSRAPVMLPVLGEKLDGVIADHQLKLQADPSGRILVRYYDEAAPLRPATVAALLAEAAAEVGDQDLTRLAERWRELDENPSAHAVATLRPALAAAMQPGSPLAAALEKTLAELERGGHLPGLLKGQRWRLANWREARTGMNYRRFFDIAHLVGVRMEDPAAFDIVHELPLRLLREGLADGLRVDHVDGLADPAAYLEHLRAEMPEDAPLYIEKILGTDEPLEDWPIDGTTGYELANAINGLFVDEAGYDEAAAFMAQRGLLEGTPPARLHSIKKRMVHRLFESELRQLARKQADRDGTAVEQAEETLAERAAALPVYRTYARLGEGADDPAERAFNAKFRQLTGALMAKSYEDTELYRWVALLSANEVGGSITAPSLSSEAFHQLFGRLVVRHPHNLLPLATHDTKRGADTRARLNALSERIDDWLARLDGWLEDTAPLTRDGNPDDLDRAYILQTLLAAWPLSRERARDHFQKAFREAKRNTSWQRPDEAYEGAVEAYVEALIQGEAGAGFRAELTAMLAELIPAGRRNALHQTALQLTLPGVPDIYWGGELWDLSLCDPDNRRPVDWAARAALLDADARPSPDEDEVGAGKLRLLADLLALRRDLPDLFAEGSYEPMAVRAQNHEPAHIAFARVHGNDQLLVVARRRNLTLDETGEHLFLPRPFQGEWLDALGGASLTLEAAVPLPVGAGIEGLPVVLKRRV